MTRAQSHVVGVALLLALTVVSLAGLTAAVGTVVERRAAAAGADHATAALDDALDPTAHGPGRERVALAGGSLRTVDRTVRVRAGGRTVLARDVGALVYRAGDRRVAYLAGALVRGPPGAARLVGSPPVRAASGTVVVSVAHLGADSGTGVDAEAATLRTNVTHARRDLRPDDYRVAVETATPAAWRAALAPLGSTARRDIDGDGVPSVVVDPADGGPLRLFVHRLRLEVTAA